MKTSHLIALASAIAFAAPALVRADPPESYTKYCASCHGKDGAGHTKAGRLVKVKDLTDAAYQKSFTDDKAFADVKNGLTEDGHVKMKPMGDKMSDDEIKSVVAYVRTLAK